MRPLSIVGPWTCSRPLRPALVSSLSWRRHPLLALSHVWRCMRGHIYYHRTACITTFYRFFFCCFCFFIRFYRRYFNDVSTTYTFRARSKIAVNESAKYWCDAEDLPSSVANEAQNYAQSKF